MSAIERRLAKLEAAAQPASPGLADALEAMRARNGWKPPAETPEGTAARIAELQQQVDALTARGRPVPELLANLLAMWRRRAAVALLV